MRRPHLLHRHDTDSDQEPDGPAWAPLRKTDPSPVVIKAERAADAARHAA